MVCIPVTELKATISIKDMSKKGDPSEEFKISVDLTNENK
jgi:hypothetical protein